MHVPGEVHISVVQALPSVQMVGIIVLEHIPKAHESKVQALPSLQEIGVYTHEPPEQLSIVQALLSLQAPQFTILEVPQLSLAVTLPQVLFNLEQNVAFVSGTQFAVQIPLAGLQVYPNGHKGQFLVIVPVPHLASSPVAVPHSFPNLEQNSAFVSYPQTH